jgi:predicted MFS family arabinose efflux permease
LFAVATLACGLAPGYTSLLLARCTAGAFGGVLGSMVQTMIGDLIPFERRGRANGTVMSSFSLSTVAGVPLSLFLANHFGWRFPFIFIAALACGFLAFGWRMLPVVKGHLPDPADGDSLKAHPLSAIASVLRDANHLKAFGFMALVMFSGFTVIPYISIYVTSTVGIPLEDIPLIYLFGGCATFFSSRLVGRLADAYGKVRVYRVMAFVSIVPLYVITHLAPVPLWVMIVYSTLFFVFVPGRMVPAMAIITSAVQPRLRGTFMSLNGAVLQMSSGCASYLAGSMIAMDASGRVVGYGTVGWLAIAASLIAIAVVGQIAMHTGKRNP